MCFLLTTLKVDQPFTAAQLRISLKCSSMSMKNYRICVSQEQPHGFYKNFQILQGWKYSYSELFYTNSKSFIAAEFISVQTRESKKQLAKWYMPMKAWNRGPVLLVTLKSRITFSMLTKKSLFILLFL